MIHIPQTYLPERTYIVKLLLRDFIGFEDEIKSSETVKNVEIELENGKFLIIEDAFWGKQDAKIPYYTAENIPESIQKLSSKLLEINDIPVLYGAPNIEETEKGLICHTDLFASAFFMLTRWEEYVITERDEHQRFEAKNALSVQQSFIQRPIVDEYVEVIKKMLLHLGYNKPFKKQCFKLHQQHDIDFLSYVDGELKFFKTLVGDILRRKSLKLFIKHFADFINIKILGKPDPYDCYAQFMDRAEKHNEKATFFFMAGGETRLDNQYNVFSKKAQKIFQLIKDRGHNFAFHPSYNSIEKPELWAAEKEKLEKTLGQKITISRQHYLRGSLHQIGKACADNNIDIDCSMGYAEQHGFRCGTCQVFPVYDFIERKELPVKEMPLIIMDVTLSQYHNLSEIEMHKEIKKLEDIVRQHRGQYLLLWHNSHNIKLL